MIKRIVFTTIRWAAAWAAAGLLVGVLMMLGKVPVIAEPGAPSNISFYAFWIPLCWGVGAFFGLVMGLIYASLLAALGQLSAIGTEPGANESAGFMGRYGWRLLCGASAGGAIGFAAIRRPEGLYLALAGVISAAVSGYLNQRGKS